MEKLRCTIIEDEADNLTNLKLLLQAYCPQAELVGEARSMADGIRLVRNVKPDLVFLDVELGDGTGFDLLAALAGMEVNVIFVTAYSHYAIQAIKFNAVDYLMKPIDIHELCLAVDKASRKSDAADSLAKIKNLISNLATADPGSRRIALASQDSLRMVEVKNIIRLEGENNYTRFHLKGESPILVSKTIKEYESLLLEHGFFRTHQSHLVNLAFVASYLKGDGGVLVMADGSQVTVSRHRKQELLERLQAG